MPFPLRTIPGTTRTSLGGDAERLSFEKVNGTFQFFEGFTRYSQGFEVNDLGFLTMAGEQLQSTWVGLNLVKPTSLYRQLSVNFSEHLQWSTVRLSASDLTDDNAGIFADAELTNSWWLHGGFSWHRFIPVYDDRATRGGPVLRRLPYTDASIEIDGDPRLRLLQSLGLFAFSSTGALSWGYGIDPSLSFRMSRSFTGVISPHFDHNSDNNQWMDNLISNGGADTAYTFGHIDQNTVSLTARIDYTMSLGCASHWWMLEVISDAPALQRSGWFISNGTDPARGSRSHTLAPGEYYVQVISTMAADSTQVNPDCEWSYAVYPPG